MTWKWERRERQWCSRAVLARPGGELRLAKLKLLCWCLLKTVTNRWLRLWRSPKEGFEKKTCLGPIFAYWLAWKPPLQNIDLTIANAIENLCSSPYGYICSDFFRNLELSSRTDSNIVVLERCCHQTFSVFAWNEVFHQDVSSYALLYRLDW